MPPDLRFGYEIKGGTEVSTYDHLRASQAILGETGITKSITIYIMNAAAAYNLRVAIYDESASKPNVLKVESAIIEVPSEYDDWITIDLADTELSAGNYWLAWQVDNSNLHVYYNAGGLRSTRAFDWAAFPAPYGASTTSVYTYSIFCTYELPLVGWTGKISGVTDPAKIMGVAVADIQSVKGIEAS